MQHRRGIRTARSLRATSTEAEQALWYRLRDRRFAAAKFRRQVALLGYVVDFICADARLVIEVDGSQHCDEVDATRTRTLEANGWRVLRFWNNDVLNRLDAVLEDILRALDAHPHPNPSPAGGRGAQAERNA